MELGRLTAPHEAQPLTPKPNPGLLHSNDRDSTTNKEILMATDPAERNEISRHEILVYQTLAKGQWITSREIADQAGVAPRTARAHALKFVRLGIAEQAEVFPGHRYRLSEYAAQRNRGYSDRIARAAEVLVDDRMTHIALFTRNLQDCTCPRGQTKANRIDGITMAGDPNGRLSTAKGCPEHDSCHHWTKENRAKYAIGRSWSIGPWCPIHEYRDCPEFAALIQNDMQGEAS